MTPDKKFAVLIDADNISDRYVKIILDEISNDGEVTYKRIYGDWTKPALAPWKKVLLEYSVTPIQQYNYTTGKNATDSAMIIDAMDILYSDSVDGFCLVSSDSDFTRLASRLRESGMIVVGMGEQKTPRAFVAACNKFRYLDILSGEVKSGKPDRTAPKSSARPQRQEKPTRTTRTRTPKDADEAEFAVSEAIETQEKEDGDITSLDEIKQALHTILTEYSDEDGWVSTSDLGSRLVKRYSDFDVRNYGFPKLTPFLKSLKGFEMKSVRSENSPVKQVYLREHQPDRAE